MKAVHYPDRSGNFAIDQEKTYSLSREINLNGNGKMVMIELKEPEEC